MPKFIDLKNKTVRVEDISCVELHSDTVTVEMCGNMQMPTIMVFSNEKIARLYYKDLVKRLEGVS